ncbi:polyphosphate polymerase domain-containing protein [Endozoicomonas euniceicola]|uniref:Polyphosphate polymerase domain-containing protein n=1 Tax=Endozoicomonas euniceicola TaxID=1234143 RepID=A0ABY6GQU0_9GAMM|nr:polyphosphate polymerase domain-containing protein [Endozoicomonas euniceicola]UYM15117.1 polyphosphate polymerase domain-containing protein [Endozoicomonas euniceicola]
MDALRFEVKIPVPVIKMQQLRLWLKRHPLLFSEQYDKRVINSLYLDSCGLARYEENLNGISERKKVRLRWYGDIADASSAKLEFKLRRSGKGKKITYKAPLDFTRAPFNWREALDNCYEQLPHEGQVSMGNGVMPILICRYEREYFISACQKIRATIDSEIEVFDQRYSNRLNITKPQSLGVYYLLELKADEAYEEELSSLISTCPLRPSRHSKYVNGIRKLVGK